MRKEGAKTFSLEYKFDGLRIVVHYKNGKIFKCATRGNGLEGEDVTEQIKTIKTLPHEISYKKDLQVMGEAMIRRSELERFNATPRWGVAPCGLGRMDTIMYQVPSSLQNRST